MTQRLASRRQPQVSNKDGQMAHITVYSNGRKSTYADAKIQSIDHGVLKFDWTFSDAEGQVVVQTITTTCPFFIEDHHEPAAAC
jgi:hypothetical protein